MCEECEEKKQRAENITKLPKVEKFKTVSGSLQVKLFIALVCIGIAYLLLLDVVF